MNDLESMLKGLRALRKDLEAKDSTDPMIEYLDSVIAGVALFELKLTRATAQANENVIHIDFSKKNKKAA